MSNNTLTPTDIVRYFLDCGYTELEGITTEDDLVDEMWDVLVANGWAEQNRQDVWKDCQLAAHKLWMLHCESQGIGDLPPIDKILTGDETMDKLMSAGIPSSTPEDHLRKVDAKGVLIVNDYGEVCTYQGTFLVEDFKLLQRAHEARQRAQELLKAAENMERLARLGWK